MCDNHTKNNLKARDGAHNRNEPHKRGLLLSFIIFMAWVAGIGLLLSSIACQPVQAKPIATDDNSGYHSLTTNCSAAKPSRHSLAIFVPKTCLTNYQQAINGMNKNTSALQASHKYSAATIGANIYDGLSEPNTIPLVGNKFRRLNTVVNDLSPYFFMGGKILTNCSGGYHA